MEGGLQPEFRDRVTWADSRARENKQLAKYLGEYQSVIQQLRDKKVAGGFTKQAAGLREFRMQRVGLGLPQVNKRLDVYLCTRIAVFLHAAGKPIATELEVVDKLVPAAEKKWSEEEAPSPAVAAVRPQRQCLVLADFVAKVG